MSYFKHIQQDVTADPLNSSTGSILALGSFVGLPASTLGVAGIQVSLKTDKNCTVHIDQSPNGSDWDINDSYNYYESINNFGVTAQAINSYERVRVVNNENTDTGYFRLQTALCPIVEAVPRSLDESGNLKIGIKSISDAYGFGVENTPMGEMRVAEPTKMVGNTFSSGTTLDTNFWSTTLVSGATIQTPTSQVTLTTNTGSNASATLQSVRSARYVGGTAQRYRAIVRLPDVGTENNYRRWGAFNGSDGNFFFMSGTSFGVGTLKGGTETKVSTGNFNGVLGGTYNPGSIVKTYETYWTNSKVWYVIGDDLLHTTTASYDTWANTMDLPVRMDNTNLNDASGNVALNCRVATISRLGKLDTNPIYKNISGLAVPVLCKQGPGILHDITVNTPTNNGTIGIYDTISGVTSPIGFLTLPNSATPIAMSFHTPFFNGLNIVPSAAGLNLTIVYE